uniref:Uncharacterized protein n=2 Tax=Musca domestica TaxID=7370 RepID=A0A1I8MJ34_MUSDO
MALHLQVEKLRGLDNYKAWSMTVRSYLETEDLWAVVEHGPDGSEEDGHKDRRAKFIILCLTDTKICQFMAIIRTSRDLWGYLKKQHSMIRYSKMTLVLTVEKLMGSENYKGWSMTLEAYLEMEEIWEVVEKGPDSSDEDFHRDRRAKFIICCLVETKLFKIMPNLRTSNDVWFYLKAKYSGEGN